MKNRSFLFWILIISCLGVTVTMNTRRLVSVGQNTETLSPFEVGQEAGGFTAAGNSPEVAMAKGSSRMAAVAQENGGETAGSEGRSARVLPEEPQAPSEPEAAYQADAVSELSQAAPIPDFAGSVSDSAAKEVAPVPEADVSVAVQNSAVDISPLTASKSPVETTIKISLSCEDYKKKLQDIDSQIQKMKDSGMEPNPDSYKNMADYEYRLWDNEVNNIYQDILTCMPEEEVSVLSKDQKEWVKQRDAIAHRAISKYNGGTMESLEYIASLADSSRARAYGLLETFGTYLKQESSEHSDSVGDAKG